MKSGHNSTYDPIGFWRSGFSGIVEGTSDEQPAEAQREAWGQEKLGVRPKQKYIFMT